MNIATQLRDYRLNTLAAIIPRGVMVPDQLCSTCGGPAGHVVGRNSGRTLVVPLGCGHHPHPADDDFAPYTPSVAAEQIVAALMGMDSKERAAACLGRLPETLAAPPVRRTKLGIQIGPRRAMQHA